MNVCMINSIRTRSRRVISCNNTSRRAHVNLLHEPTDDDDDNKKVLLVEREREMSRLARSKSCQMTVAKGQNRSILVRLWSVDKYKQL